MPTKMVDASTRKIVEVDDSEVQQLWDSGKYGFLKKEPIALADPNTGKIAMHSASDAHKLFSAGHTFAGTSAFQAQQDEEKYGGLGGGVIAGALGVGRGLSAGLLDPLAVGAAGLIGGAAARESVRETLSGYERTHPIKSTVGEVGGAILPFIGTGGASGAASGVAESARLAKLATEGVEVAEATARAAEAAKIAEGASATSKFAREGVNALLAEGKYGAAREAAIGAKAATSEAINATKAAQAAEEALNAQRLLEAERVASLAKTAETGIKPAGAISTILDASPAKGIGLAGELAESGVAAIVGKGSTNAVARIAQTALRKGAAGAVEGALYGAGSQLSEDALGNHETTADKLLGAVGHGALFGGVLGGGLGTVGEVASIGIEKASPKLRELAHGQVIKALSYGGLAPKKYINQLERIPGGVRGVAQEIIDSGLIKPLDTFETLAPKVRRAADEAGAEITTTAKMLDGRGAIAPNLNSLEKVIRRDAEGVLGTLKELNTAGYSKVDDAVASLRNHFEGKPITLESLRNFRSELDKQINFVRLENPLAPQSPALEGLRSVRRSLEGEVERTIDAEAKRLHLDPQTLDTYKAQKIRYARLNAASTLAEDSVSRATKNNLFGMSEKVSGLALAGHALMSGHPLGLAAAATTMVGGKLVREYGNATAAHFLSKVADLTAVRKTLEKADNRLASSTERFFEGKPSKELPSRTVSKAERERSYDLAVKRTKAANADLESSSAEVHSHLGTLVQSAPKVAAAFTRNAVRATNFLLSKIPAERKPLTFQPQIKSKIPTVTEQDQERFLRYSRAVNDPWSILDDASRNQLTREGVEAVQVCYPQIYSQIKRIVMDRASDPNAKPLTYDQQIQLSVLLGQPTSEALKPEKIAAYQAMYASKEKAPAPKPSPRSSKKFELDTTPLKLSGFGGKV